MFRIFFIVDFLHQSFSRWESSEKLRPLSSRTQRERLPNTWETLHVFHFHKPLPCKFFIVPASEKTKQNKDRNTYTGVSWFTSHSVQLYQGEIYVWLHMSHPPCLYYSADQEQPSATKMVRMDENIAQLFFKAKLFGNWPWTMTLKNKTYLNSQLYLAGLPVILLCPASTFWKLETQKETGSTGSTLRRMEVL